VLGDEGAQSAVRDALQKLGFSGRSLTGHDEAKLFEWLGNEPGLIGTAARRVQGSFVLSAVVPEPPRTATTYPNRVAKAPIGPDTIIQGSELVGMFASAVGDEKAREMIEAECRRMNLNFARLPVESALALLDEFSKTPGIIGIAARFAKARLALR
jgi:hypothetical protein